ncbi:response regulator [Mesobacillus selenatarsenatis]|uniref:response regulator n=1 Tax=Mesobacillus selenatarsenatis TaxID=388741 RepID=UPI00069371C9|nr:response regulator transcription factor [Mesobacillus selenatarsenatis]
MIRILLADDHNLVRSGLKILLSQVENFKIVGEAENGKELLELVKKTNPDIILLDINMPYMDGFETIPAIKAIKSTIKIVMLTMYSDQDSLVRAMELGANGYILKKAPEEELISGIKNVMEDGSYVDTSLAQSYINSLINKKSSSGRRPIQEKKN